MILQKGKMNIPAALPTLYAAINKYRITGAVSLRNRLMYPAESFSPGITFIILVYVFSRLYKIAVPGGSAIAGYDSSMLVYYFVIAEVSLFGFGRLFTQLSDEVKNGHIGYSLGRPYDFIFYYTAEQIGPALVQMAYLGLIGFVLACVTVGPPGHVSLLQASMTVLSLLISALLNLYLRMALALSAFWFEENAAFYWIFQKLSLVIGTLIPIEFLPGNLRSIAVWTPFPYIAYAPGRIAVAFEPVSAGKLICAQSAWLLISFALCRAVFAAGRRKIELNAG